MSSDKDEGLISEGADRDAEDEEGVVVFGWPRRRFVSVCCVHGGLVVDMWGWGFWTGGRFDRCVVKRLQLNRWELNPM